MGTLRRKDVFSLDDFDMGEEIGKGGFGTVCKAICKRGWLANTEVAIKKVSSKHRSELVRQEVENHQSIEHENIVKFYGCFKDEKEDSYIVMELCSEGSLRHYIRKRGSFSQEQAVFVLRQIVDAIQHLHSKGICHRDLTAGNVLVHRVRQNGDVYVKICDFGLAKVMATGRAAHTVAGTPGYMDPHVMNREKYGKEVDVYALGCLLYTMLAGQEPVPDTKSRFPRLKSLEKDARDLIEQFTDPDVNSRINLEHVKSAPFLRNCRLSSDHPSSSRRSMEQKSREGRTATSTERRSTRERSKSRGPLKEANESPPAPSRQPCRSRGSSQVRAHPTENTNPDWPLDHRLISRLKGKREEFDGYLLEIGSNEAVLTEHGGKKIMIIDVDERRQKVRCAPYNRGYDDDSWKLRRSMDRFSTSELHHYKMVLKLLERIRGKVAKVIENKSSICKGAVIKLMENGDLIVRLTDKDGTLYSVSARSPNVVYKGNPRHPSGTVSNPTKRAEILGYREWCKDLEALVEKRGYKFPYISYDISMEEHHRTSRERSAQRVSRAKSTASHVRQPLTDAAVTARSAPAGSMQQNGKENIQGRRIVFGTFKGQVIYVEDKDDGGKLEINQRNSDQYVYTNSKGIERRFTFTGDYSSLSAIESYLMKKLINEINKRMKNASEKQ